MSSVLAGVEYGPGPGAGIANLAHGRFCLTLGQSKPKCDSSSLLRMLPHHLDKVSPCFHSGTVEKLHGFLHSNPALSAVERSKRMSCCQSICCRSLGNITSEGLLGRALLAGDGQLLWLQECRRWFMATIPVQIEAPSAVSMFS